MVLEKQARELQTQQRKLESEVQKMEFGQQKKMLENAVSKIPELNMVKTNDDISIAKGESPLSYRQYQNILRATATAYDSSHGLRSKYNGRPSSRNVNMTMIEEQERQSGIKRRIAQGF